MEKGKRIPMHETRVFIETTKQNLRSWRKDDSTENTLETMAGNREKVDKAVATQLIHPLYRTTAVILQDWDKTYFALQDSKTPPTENGELSQFRPYFSLMQPAESLDQLGTLEGKLQRQLIGKARPERFHESSQ